MKILLITTPEQDAKIAHLANFVRTKRGKPTQQSTRILRFCIDKTYEFYKDVKT